jgi:catechol 2,3-dioxygenase-like lactoylglutathione lyase family enzyme
MSRQTSESPSAGPAQLLRAAPYLLVRDPVAAAAYYTAALGFQVEYTGGEPPEFVIVSRDGLPLMLKRAPRPDAIVPNEPQGGTWDVFYWVRDVQALHQELTGRGATVVYGPALQPYGVLEFAVRDETGYVLGFGEAQG